MATMHITLPDGLKAWVEAQGSNGRYHSASDFVRDLIRREQDRQDEKTQKLAALQAIITESLNSGLSDATPEDIKRRFMARKGPSEDETA